jgi:oligopeptide transport system substrate-binding protein
LQEEKEMKKFALLAILATALALIVAACGAPATPPPTTAPAQPTAAPAQPTAAPEQPTSAPAQPTTAPAQPTTAPQPTEAPTQAPAAAGPKVLRIGRGTYPDVLDPQKSSYGIEIEVLKLAYEGLLSLDNKGNIGPGGADKWEKSADGTSMTFHIRDGLKRWDGTPITAKDYEYALKREVDPCVPGKQYTSILYDVKGAKELDDYGTEIGNDCTKADKTKLDALWADYGVKALDDSNLQVTFKQPTGFWEYIAYTWVTYPTDQRAVDKDPDTWWTKAENHVGNGPFKIQSIDEGKKIVFVPNENYWRGKAKLDRIELIYNTDNAVIFEAYKNGELDIDANLAPEQLAAVDADPTLKSEFLRYPAAITIAIAFNNSRKPFDDKNVRSAFSAGFDREAWIRDVSQGVGGPYTRWIPPGVPGAQPDKPGVPSYDPAAAVKTLVDNGYAAADSTADKPKIDCNKLGELKLTYAASPLNHARFQFIAGNYVKVFGCPITLDPVDATVYTALTKDVKTNPQISRQGWIEDYPHPQNWLSVYWVCGAFSSRYGYCNPELDKQLKDADTTLDFEQAIKKYQAAEDILIGDIPAAFSNYTENIYLVRPYVIGPKDYPSSSDAEWAGEWGPVWTYDIDLSKVPANYPKQ